MLSAAPTVIIESNTNWPAIIASISAGVAAVAGIAGTLWQANRNWKHDDDRAKVAEKRRIYASCIATLSKGMQAAIFRSTHPGDTKASREYNNALIDCLTAVSELALIAPAKVTDLGADAVLQIRAHVENNQAFMSGAIALTVRAMRVDLGEPQLNIEDAKSIIKHEFGATNDMKPQGAPDK